MCFIVCVCWWLLGGFLFGEKFFVVRILGSGCWGNIFCCGCWVLWRWGWWVWFFLFLLCGWVVCWVVWCGKMLFCFVCSRLVVFVLVCVYMVDVWWCGVCWERWCCFSLGVLLCFGVLFWVVVIVDVGCICLLWWCGGRFIRDWVICGCC